MTWNGHLPTYLTMEQALKEYFLSGVYVDFPIKCRCGFQANYFSGISVHMRKKHGIYIKKDKSVHKKHKNLYIEYSDKEKMGSGIPVTFYTDKSLSNTK